MTQVTTLSPKMQEKLAKLADLLDQAGKVMRELSRNSVSSNEKIWEECDELQKAFADLSETQVDRLINEAVITARHKTALV